LAETATVARIIVRTMTSLGLRAMSQSMNITTSAFHIARPLALPSHEVHLWRVDLQALGVEESRWKELLSSDELRRAARFHFARDRQHFVASRALLRTILASYLNLHPGRLNFSYSKKEKPSLEPAQGSDITFNVSHSGGIALMAFTRGREIGVDIEQVRPDADLEAIARRFFSTNEQNQLAALPANEKTEAFFRCWTRKEAYIKATGDGLSLPLSQFDVALVAAETSALKATRPDASEGGLWLLREVPAGPDYIAALCVRGRGWQLVAWSGEAA
jgi:4'-phosphopantetheinyl transferase